MSGPIVRKYGFPNFDKIFGERPLQHGADDPEASDDASERASDPRKKAGTTRKQPSEAKTKKQAP